MTPVILLVEDDETLAYGLKYSLEKADFSVIHANTAAAAIEKFSPGTDLVLLDIMLPDGSGYDVCRKMRESSDIPIIFLTACDSEANAVAGLDLGADDYICKPFRLGELTSRIRAVLRRYEKASGLPVPEEEYGGLTLIETKLLSMLRENRGQTLTRMQILNKLWDNKGEFVDDNTLSVHISRLREKVGADHIITVRGVGYKWAD